MVRHVDLLARLHKIWGGLAIVAGVAILIQGLGALVVVVTAEPGSSQSALTAGFATALFFVFAFGALGFGGMHLHNGIGLRRRHPRARTVGLVLSALNIFFLPFGTALALYAFWVLLSDATRSAFALPAPPPSASSDPAAG